MITMKNLIEAYKSVKETLKKAREMKYYNAHFEKPEDLDKLDQAVDLSIEAINKQIPFQLTDKDEEELTGICKCGRVTAKVSGEFYCKYCGQRVYW